MNIETMSDDDLIAHALNMWANHIETGKVALSAEDAKRSGQSMLLRPMADSQKSLVTRLRDLSSEARQDNIQSSMRLG